MNTDELINNIKNGDEESFKVLLKHHHSMIYKIIYNLDLETGDYLIDVDSLYQEGSIALYSAVFSYEKDKAMSFSSYAYMVVRSRLHTYIRDTYRKRINDCLSIDNHDAYNYEFFATNGRVSDYPLQYHREREFADYLYRFVGNLSKEDQEIFKLRSEDYSYKEIASRLNIKTKKIDNRLRVLRKRLKEYLDEEE